MPFKSGSEFYISPCAISVVERQPPLLLILSNFYSFPVFVNLVREPCPSNYLSSRFFLFILARPNLASDFIITAPSVFFIFYFL